jgi:CheY-like chemotaxis protein
MVSLAFQERGIEVTAVGNGEAAVRRIPDLNPDVVLADIFMPVRNGYELCEWVKKDPKYSHIPVILLVGAFDPLDEKEARRVGADGILKKPFIPPDPLIAMVASVLEKASKAAAENPKPQEASVLPPSPAVALQIPSVEIAAPIATTTLPELPDTRDDDASLAYGFGAGHRGIDDEGLEQSAADRAPKSDSEKQAEEEFDGASTTSDWRRSAREFEIPEETAQRHAVSQDIDSTFPLECEVPPQPIHVELSNHAIEPATEIRDGRAEPPASLIVEMEPVATFEDSVEEVFASPVAAAADEENTLVRARVSSEALQPEPEILGVPVVEAAGEPELRPVSRGSHWMDLMASTGLQGSQGDWLSTATAAPDTRAGSHVEELIKLATGPETQELSAHEVQVETRAKVEELDAPEQQSETQESAMAVPPQSQESIGDDESFFADEPATITSSAVPALSINEPQTAQPVDLNAPATEIPDDSVLEPATEFEATVAEPVSASVSADSELIGESSEEPNLSKDPDLVEPPAVHVTPEPLLIDESPQDASLYGAREQEIPPVYSFLARVAEKRDSPGSESSATLAKSLAAEKPPTPAENPESLLDFSSSEFDDRMPSCTPSREALAEIPFLNPPRSYHPDTERPRAVNGDVVEAVNIDAVVQRILEKIEPQLREMLSQNLLKPLITSLVQNEFQKKKS